MTLTFNAIFHVTTLANGTYWARAPKVSTGDLYPIRLTPAGFENNSLRPEHSEAAHPIETFKLFKAPVLSGTFSATNLPATDASGTVYTWTNNLPGDGTITVLTVVPPPAILTNSLSGSSLTLSWPPGQGWRLQTNSVSVTAPSWFDYPGSTSINSVTLTVNPTKTNVYYRLINP